VKHGGWIFPVALFGFLLWLLGGRVLNETSWSHRLVDAAGIIFLSAALVSTWRAMRLRGPVRGFAAAVAGLLWLCGSAWATSELLYEFPEVWPPAVLGALRWLWPALLVMGIIPFFIGEMLLQRLLRHTEPDVGMSLRALASAMAITMGVITFAGINRVADLWDHQWDLSGQGSSLPSESTTAIVRALDTTVVFHGFFPTSHALLRPLQSYFETLQQLSSHAQWRVFDHARDPSKARELDVHQNGVIAVTYNKRTERINLGLNPEDMRQVLRELDSRVQTAILSASRPTRVLYITAGHGERTWTPSVDGQESGLVLLRRIAERSGMETKQLTLLDGASSTIPSDATIVAIIGAMSAPLPAEVLALQRFHAQGGSILLALEQDGWHAEDFLGPMGLTLQPGLIANGRYQVTLPGGGGSPYIWGTSRTALHPSTRAMGRSDGRLGVIGSNIAPFAMGDDASLKPVMYPMPGSTVENISYEGGWIFAGNAPSRTLVLGDADLLGNMWMHNPGNEAFAHDALAWLSHDDQPSGSASTSNDVAMIHREGTRRGWFYGTTLGVPFATCLLGLFYVRRSRSCG
jgi:hypothetical protein